MKISKLLRKPAVFAVVVALSAAGIHAPVMAGTIDTPEIAMQAELQMQRDDVRSIMARADVRGMRWAETGLVSAELITPRYGTVGAGNSVGAGLPAMN